MLKWIKPTLLSTLVSAFCLFALAGETAARTRALLLHASASAPFAVNDREQDGLSGPVRRVKTETAKITAKNGTPSEGPRVVLETATYDVKGNKIDNAYFLAAAGGTLTGKEVYKYDDKGNIVEMTLRNEDGSLMGRETYSYEFDVFGNWTKMVTSVAVIEGGKMSFEPTEVTYRTLSYFLDEATLAKMSQPAAPAAASAPAANANAPAPQPSASSPTASNPAPAKQPAENDAAVNKMAAAPPPAATSGAASVAAAPSVGAARMNTSSGASVVDTESEAPDRSVARGPVKPVSGGILNGKAVSLPSPIYPEMAKRARTSGLVTIEVVIDVTGRVISAKAVNGPAMLKGAAEKAAMQARFSPTLLSGQPVKVSGQITYNFTLSN